MFLNSIQWWTGIYADLAEVLDLEPPHARDSKTAHNIQSQGLRPPVVVDSPFMRWTPRALPLE